MKFKYNGNIDEFIESVKTNVSQLNDDKLGVFNNETKMEINIVDDKCKILLEKDNPHKTQYWFVSTIIKSDNCVIIDGKIKECIRTKKEKTILALLYTFIWPIIPIIWLLNEWTPFHSIKYRKNRLRELMIKYTGCEEL